MTSVGVGAGDFYARHGMVLVTMMAGSNARGRQPRLKYETPSPKVVTKRYGTEVN